ncbi:LAETG motif-containing sortase-dependent surface protein [Streptomyces sp. NBC_00083]|uniref:LAETG motif-containing sortase-dependent surface protein n=1 Tax=Streptomyces sp. NBC_00083 TaxID=2975647 RepID=UPI002B1DB9FE|nr:LAETG motif-containing sortase-dependent surface protein [Streptomyces sp. NBC_00083]
MTPLPVCRRRSSRGRSSRPPRRGRGLEGNADSATPGTPEDSGSALAETGGGSNTVLIGGAAAAVIAAGAGVLLAARRRTATNRH